MVIVHHESVYLLVEPPLRRTERPLPNHFMAAPQCIKCKPSVAVYSLSPLTHTNGISPGVVVGDNNVGKVGAPLDCSSRRQLGFV